MIDLYPDAYIGNYSMKTREIIEDRICPQHCTNQDKITHFLKLLMVSGIIIDDTHSSKEEISFEA